MSCCLHSLEGGRFRILEGRGWLSIVTGAQVYSCPMKYALDSEPGKERDPHHHQPPNINKIHNPVLHIASPLLSSLAAFTHG